ncbi:FadR/GntR family transcriptional regulator [Leucobacter massiliensis]|uniref:GntR family transcriptional regulator n=1 Tax=Leucobacter massiliensis TaxID=1686285 RepID=A0A2S9QMB5_9MICO|nr:FadR/GntR family transcriptional regulator [Leucobacter massiliensis]PRI10724.1 GntR family transcriptional regulator [Leucobacter massiliensis]
MHSPVQRVSATEAAFQAIRALIDDAELTVGDRLPGEIALARQFGVSRSVVREALHACATLGLTETRSGSGTYVVSKTPSGVSEFGGFDPDELMEARIHVEVPTAGHAAERRTEAELDAMRQLVARMVDTVSLHEWVRLDRDFHTLIAEASHNSVLVSITASMRRSLDLQSEFLNITQARQRDSDVEHAEILAAVEAGDRAAAERAARHHIDAVAAAIRAGR